MKEIFKDIKGYEGSYQVSNLGRVKSLKKVNEIVLKATPSRGYLKVMLYKDGEHKTCSIHQLVAMAFLGHLPNGHEIEVDHKDGDKLNNTLANLHILTQEEHTRKTYPNKSSKYIGVHWIKRDSRWQARIRINGKQKHIGYFTSELEASEVYQAKLKTL